MPKAALKFSTIHKDNALTCRWCGNLTVVKDSRPAENLDFTATLRRRSCTECNKRYNTIEITTAYYTRLTGVGIPMRVASVINILRTFLQHVDEIESDATPSK